MFLYYEGTTQTYWKWRLKQNIGNKIRLNNLEACCFAGVLQMYDGFDNYYLMAQEQVSNYSLKVLNITSTYYMSTLVFQLNKTSIKPTKDTLFIVRYEKEIVKVRYIDVDTVNSVNNHGHVLHSIIAINMTNGGYPNVSIIVRSFNGWNDNLCLFGGYRLTHEIKTQSFNLTYQQGPFCNWQAPSVPFIGTHGPKHIVFGSFRYWLTIYACGPLYEIDIDVVIRRSSCEGLFEPVYMCTAPILGYHNQFYTEDQVMRFVNVTNYRIRCMAAMQPNKELAYHLRIFNIKICLIFQIISLLPNSGQMYQIRATMSADIAITMGPSYLLAYDRKAGRIFTLRFSLMDHVTNTTSVEGPYKSSPRNASDLSFTFVDVHQQLGLYIISKLAPINRKKNCRVGNVVSYIENDESELLIGIVGINSLCGKYSFVKGSISLQLIIMESFIYIASMSQTVIQQ